MKKFIFVSLIVVGILIIGNRYYSINQKFNNVKVQTYLLSDTKMPIPLSKQLDMERASLKKVKPMDENSGDMNYYELNLMVTNNSNKAVRFPSSIFELFTDKLFSNEPYENEGNVATDISAHTTQNIDLRFRTPKYWSNDSRDVMVIFKKYSEDITQEKIVIDKMID